jgi:preprotein translocase subunit SecB
LGYRISEIRCNIEDSFHPQNENYNFHNNVAVFNNLSKSEPRFVEAGLNIQISTEPAGLLFSIIIKGGFRADEDMDDKTFKTLCEQNAPAILLPIARGILLSYTAQANIPPISLPLMDFTQKRKTPSVTSKPHNS